MDRKEPINEILEKISPKTDFRDESHMNKLLNGVAGFMPATDFTDNAMLISNLGYLFAKNGYNTCILDLKVFYPNLYSYLDVAPNKKGRGLMAILKSDKIDIRTEINVTKYENLYLLSPSPQDAIEEYFDFEISDVTTLITVLHKIFDVVLIDIPNNPPLEFCVGAVEKCNIGFFTASERLDAINNITRFLDYSAALGIGTAKFANAVFMNVQDCGFDYDIIKRMKIQITAQLPLIKAAITNSFEGMLYIKDNALVNQYFHEQLENIARAIVNLG